mgnify:CR=1 FL=1
MRATDQLPDAPRWRGINHLALVTPDMDTTVRFYAGTLGMRLVATTMAGPMRQPRKTTLSRNLARIHVLSLPPCLRLQTKCRNV